MSSSTLSRKKIETKKDSQFLKVINGEDDLLDSSPVNSENKKLLSASPLLKDTLKGGERLMLGKSNDNTSPAGTVLNSINNN